MASFEQIYNFNTQVNCESTANLDKKHKCVCLQTLLRGMFTQLIVMRSYIIKLFCH